jgi:pimeloyl-ACP methyl ester carboxylesterase
MDALDLREVVLAGISFGGWIAAEIAIKSTARISHLVLADAVGIKLGDREHRDIVDMFTTRHAKGMAYSCRRGVSGLPSGFSRVRASPPRTPMTEIAPRRPLRGKGTDSQRQCVWRRGKDCTSWDAPAG